MVLGAAAVRAQTGAAPVGIFTDHTDVGVVLHPGSVQYDEAGQTYTIAGSGENVWGTADAFQFVWKKMEGDFALTADIAILGEGGNPHKKAMLMARQSLDADSAYADVAVHASGLTSLQSREAKGEETHEVQANVSAPKRVRLLKHGDEFSLWIAGEDGKFQPSGAAMRVPLIGSFYVGRGVCGHDKGAVETAAFMNIVLEAPPSGRTAEWTYGTLEAITVASTDRRVVYVGAPGGPPGGPAWAPNGAFLLLTIYGRIEIVPVAGGEPKVVETGLRAGTDCHHGISPDGTLLAFDSLGIHGEHAIYVGPLSGGEPRQIAAKRCTWNGWSPDSKTIVYNAWRHGRPRLCTIPAAGGKEKVLSEMPLVGSAEYSPDGQYIYFNSDRSGPTEIWRITPDGSQQKQVTKDGLGNWFPHISPDGRLLAFLTPQQHIPNFPLDSGLVMLRVMTLADGQIRVLARFRGWLLSMPNPCWSSDGKQIAFVSFNGSGW